ncbi:hypothetical protein P691DRAFT_802186 [Macrolepiota fuliginosa MF-IS2]|uniref:Nephrocystin 3-like N-terminal domain-containing protein n=1 Tax=Macrolepiota fuliginosa MF-IS2 TaxID=1400762 RepID=A0A9P5XCI6_9AGAR|nr:hypothetical protein P691DRAFT_802186 [Macrolepiota fuliginosa MF-IS2]
MPIFPNAQGIVINNSQFTDQLINVSNGPTGIDILLNASLPDAAHDSSARDHAPRCFPGTREQYVEDAVQWAIPAINDTPLPIFRMKGPAGVGKSAVAQTSVEEVKARGKLGAAFFFSINGRDQLARFVTTIAYQLSTNYPDYQDLIERKIRRDRTLVHKALASQFHELIVQPLQELENSGKGIGKKVPIFVDGLDECEDESAQCTIIEIVASSVRNGNLPLCWAFFSRPEPHIEATFSRPDISTLSHTVVLPISRDSDGDIEIYLRAGFENILRRRDIRMDVPWPPEDAIKLLVKTSGGLFIYVASVLRFIDQAGPLGPEGPLLAVLAAISHKGAATAPFANLDAFYMLILGRIPEELLPYVRLLLSMLCHLNSPQNTIIFANLLRLSKMEQQTVCNRLSAVLQVRDPNQAFDVDPDIDTSCPYLENPRLSHEDIGKLSASVFGRLGGQIYFYHKSFRDFLIDPRRSGFSWLNPPAMHELLFEHCFRLELEYERAPRIWGSGVSPSFPKSPFSL